MIEAHNKALIECAECGGKINVEAVQIGLAETYENCPLCGGDDIDALPRQ